MKIINKIGDFLMYIIGGALIYTLILIAVLIALAFLIPIGLIFFVICMPFSFSFLFEGMNEAIEWVKDEWNKADSEKNSEEDN